VSETTIRKNLDPQILRAIDCGLQILGEESVKRAFYYHVEKRSKMKRQEIPCNLDAFHKILIDLFGDGALILERRIARCLFDELNLEFEVNNGWHLADYVKKAQRLS
jgi:hypothetical protein